MSNNLIKGLFTEADEYYINQIIHWTNETKYSLIDKNIGYLCAIDSLDYVIRYAQTLFDDLNERVNNEE